MPDLMLFLLFNREECLHCLVTWFFRQFLIYLIFFSLLLSFSFSYAYLPTSPTLTLTLCVNISTDIHTDMILVIIKYKTLT